MEALANRGRSESLSKPGCLVAVVGLDGAGKTTQVSMLGDWLRTRGVPNQAHTSLTLAPVRRALDLAARERGLEDHLALIGGETMRLISACTQLARVSAIERHLVATGELVILDRYTYCQYALAQAERVGDVDFLRSLLRGAREPDLTIFLDVSPVEAHRRISARGTDEESLEFLESFRAAYLDLPESSQFVKVDGDGDVESVQGALRAAVSSAIPHLFTGTL